MTKIYKAKGDYMFRSRHLKKRVATSSIAIMLGAALLVDSMPVSAAPTTFGKWSNRVQAMSSVSATSLTHWTNGAAKWNSTNYKLSVVSGMNSTYYAIDVNNPNVDWDGYCTYTLSNGVITKAVLNLNTHYTSQSKYTSSIVAGLAGHEIGHSLGLEHTSVIETTSIMHPYTFNSSGSTLRALSPSSTDKATVNSLYPLAKLAASRANLESLDDAKVIYAAPSWSVYYEDEHALAEAADLVVRGTVSSELGSQFVKGNYKDYKTLVHINVAEVIKGDQQKADNITLAQIGGTDGDVTVVSEHATHLKQKQEVVLFLRQSNDGTYRAINENDGIYLLEDGAYQNLTTNKVLSDTKIKSLK